jgi:pimeloyl-ACP methyl ester carboxylesterase
MDEQQAFAEVNGTRLYYEIAGSGHPLVLIHGFTLDTRMWDDQFEAFAQHYRVVRYDMRGYGKSAVPTDESYSQTDDLKALLEHLGIDLAHVLGQSRGGAVAIDFAPAYPEATSALVLVDPVLGGHSWSQEAARTDGAVWETAAKSGVEAGKAQWLAHPLFAPAQEKPEVAARIGQMVSDYSGWHLINTDPVRYADPPAVQRLHEISTPTLVVVGERDLPDFHAIADTLQQIPDARKVVLPGVGHMCNMENPTKFNEVVLDFLADL